MTVTPLTANLIQELTFLLDYSMSMRLFFQQADERLSEIQSMIEKSDTELERAYVRGIHDGMILTTNDINQIYTSTAANYNLISQNTSESETNSNDNN